ncbi:YbaB/EbfC family nucleoid-associated protein [Nocardia flavorosea]|uniref:YbaB/EbfC family nucleoid-associated protein n=1 Tax=Nocardia flavorosea TaxID=53429 RepID=UPI0018948B26|nr:YbaB/EbfC family nucleoid-associated protein [Nocardia flavorosea]MBF6351199.1 YbaB/EbfC family nucleoid-associated protein [Nocardia flavorosea]
MQDHSPLHDALRDQIDQLTTAFESQQKQLAEIRQQLAVYRVAANSSDGLVEVTVDAEGTVVQTRVTAKAMRSTPQKLEFAITEAARAAAAAAREHHESVLSPLLNEADAAPDLPDLLPGAASFSELRESLLGWGASVEEVRPYGPSGSSHVR